jgi:hypothetical protein
LAFWSRLILQSVFCRKPLILLWFHACHVQLQESGLAMAVVIMIAIWREADFPQLFCAGRVSCLKNCRSRRWTGAFPSLFPKKWYGEPVPEEAVNM